MPRRRNSIALIIGLVVLFAAGLTAALFLRPRDPQPVQARAGKPTVLHVRFPIPALRATMAPFVAAKRMGSYSAEGLEVDFRYGGSGTNPVSMVLGGQDDVGILGGPDTLLVADGKGVDLVAIAVLHKNADFSCLITLAKSGIRRVEQLAGKRVGLFPGHISTDVLHSLFRKVGVSVQEVDAGYDYSQLISGQLDAQWAFTTAAAVELPEQGIPVNVISPANYGIRTHGYTVFVRRDQLEPRRDVLTRFLAATFRGLHYSHGNPTEVAKLLVLEDASGNLKQAQVERRLAELDPLTSNFNPLPPGHMDSEMFRTTYDRLLDLGLIKQPYDVNTAFDESLVQAANNASMKANADLAGVDGGR